MYHGQTLFAEVSRFLQSRGFRLAAENRWAETAGDFLFLREETSSPTARHRRRGAGAPRPVADPGRRPERHSDCAAAAGRRPPRGGRRDRGRGAGLFPGFLSRLARAGRTEGARGRPPSGDRNLRSRYRGQSGACRGLHPPGHHQAPHRARQSAEATRGRRQASVRADDQPRGEWTLWEPTAPIRDRTHLRAEDPLAAARAGLDRPRPVRT